MKNGPKPSLSVESSTFTDDEIRSAFQAFDIDKNMYIGSGEIKHILALIGEHASQDEIDEMIRLCDTDGSGMVSYDGFHALFTGSGTPDKHISDVIDPEQRLPRPTQSPNAMDAFGHLMEEFCQAHDITPNFVRNLYKRVQETNKSNPGRLGYEDFLHVLRCDDSVSMRRLFDTFDIHLLNEIDVRNFLVCLIMHSRSIRFEEKLKIAFSMMTSNNSPDNTIDRSSLKELLTTFFTGYEMLSTEFAIDERVDKVFESSRDGSLRFDDFMDVVETNPELVLPAPLRDTRN